VCFGLVALATPQGNNRGGRRALRLNKTKAVLIAFEVSGDILDGAEEVLEHPDLPPGVRDELAEIISTRRVEIET